MPTLRILGALGGLLLAGTLWWVASAGDTDGAGSEPATEPLPTTPRPAAEPSTEEPTSLAATLAEPVQLSVSAAAPVPPGCTVEIWAQQRNATGPGHHPVATQLEFGLSPSRNDLGEPLQLIETGADGRAVMELPWHLAEAPADGKPPWLWVRSQGMGLLTRVARRRAPNAPGESASLAVTIQTGVVVTGRILGPDGEPAAGRVDWWSFGDEGVTSGFVGKAGADGLFSGELTRAGTHGLLAKGYSARDASLANAFNDPSLQLGTGLSELFEVRFDEAVPFIEVQVFGPGVIRGRILDAAGAPAAGISLMAVVAALDGEASGTAIPYSRTRDIDQEGRGNARVYMVTDTNGAFEARGLRDDLFNVRAADLALNLSGFPLLLTPQPVPSHGEPLELQLSRPHLAIHVTQADGSLPPESFSALRMGRIGSDLDEWPEAPGLLVILGWEDVPVNKRYGGYLKARATGPGEFIVELDDDVTVVVGALGGDLPWRPLQVNVPPGAGRVDVDLVMPEPARPGTLVLDVVDSAGEPVVQQLRVRVSESSSGVTLVDKPFDILREGDWPLRLSLPEGEYDLLVEGHPWIDWHHGTVVYRRGHGKHEQPLLISPAQEIHVTSSISDGARLSLSIHGQPTAADRQAVRDWDPREDTDEFVEFWARYVELHLEREGRWPERVDFPKYTEDGTPAVSRRLLSGIALGSEGVSEMLSPGEYTLVATTQGGRTVRRDVRLIAGQTLAVTLSFD